MVRIGVGAARVAHAYDHREEIAKAAADATARARAAATGPSPQEVIRCMNRRIITEYIAE